MFTDLLIGWLAYLVLTIPSVKHNSRTARAADLASSVINVISSRDVYFRQPQQLQWLFHGATFVPLCALIVSSQPGLGYDLQ